MKRIFLVVAVVLPIPLFLATSQSAPETRTLSIAGRSGNTKAYLLNGKSYIDLEDLARLTQGSLSFKANQIVLTLPAASTDMPATAPQAKPGFSKEFLQAGIEQMGAIREWRITIVNAIQNNYPVPEQWISEQRRKADRNLALALAARSTEDDRSGYPLLSAEFANMQKLSDRFLSQRKQLQYINPGSLDNDPLDQQILSCARSLASVAADNRFHEETACSEV
jgi:hypothetical protein